MASPQPQPETAAPAAPIYDALVVRPITVIGARAIKLFEFIGGIGYLLLDTVVDARRALLVGRGKRMGWRNLWAQMVRVGVKSIPIVMLVLYCIGAILAFQMSPTLKTYGAVDRVADIISVAVFRELGPLVSAIVLTGFAGASIAAEIGTMVVSEEVEALQKMRKTNGRIFLTNLQPRVKSLLDIARLGSIFTLTKDEAEALSK